MFHATDIKGYSDMHADNGTTSSQVRPDLVQTLGDTHTVANLDWNGGLRNIHASAPTHVQHVVTVSDKRVETTTRVQPRIPALGWALVPRGTSLWQRGRGCGNDGFETLRRVSLVPFQMPGRSITTTANLSMCFLTVSLHHDFQDPSPSMMMHPHPHVQVNLRFWSCRFGIVTVRGPATMCTSAHAPSAKSVVLGNRTQSRIKQTVFDTTFQIVTASPVQEWEAVSSGHWKRKDGVSQRGSTVRSQARLTSNVPAAAMLPYKRHTPE